MVADVFNTIWKILSKQEIEEPKGVSLNFLEYMALKQGVRIFIKKASKKTLNMGPHNLEMSNLVLPPPPPPRQKKGCQDIYRKTSQFSTKILQDFAKTWEKNFEVEWEYENIKKSILLTKKGNKKYVVIRCTIQIAAYYNSNKMMNLYDVQFKLLHTRIATK